MHGFDGIDSSHFWLPFFVSIDVAEDDHLSVGAVGSENLSDCIDGGWIPCGGILRQTFELSDFTASMECALDDCCMSISEGVTVIIGEEVMGDVCDRSEVRRERDASIGSSES